MSAPIPICILNDTRIDLHHGCNRVMGAIETLAAASGMQVLARHPAHSDWSRDTAFLRALEQSKLVIVNGEGTLHHDRPAGRKLLEVGAHARALGIPAVLVNAGWEANSQELLQMLNQFALISLRDSASAHEVRQSGRDCRVIPDLSLYETSPTTPLRERNGIGFTDSVDRFKAVQLDSWRRQIGGSTVSIVYPSGGPVNHLRFVRAGFAARDAMHPGLLLRIVRMRHRLARASSSRTACFIDALRGFRLLVSGRFHACTLAIVAGTPFISIASNTGKIAAFVNDAELDAWRVDTPLELRSVAEASAAGWSPREREAIASYLARARSGAEQLFRDIRALAT